MGLYSGPHRAKSKTLKNEVATRPSEKEEITETKLMFYFASLQLLPYEQTSLLELIKTDNKVKKIFLFTEYLHFV